MEERPIPDRKRQLTLISKAFLHQIGTCRETRHLLLEAVLEAETLRKAGDEASDTTFQAKVAFIVNDQLELDAAGLTLQTGEMDAFNAEMQDRHSETATPGTFNSPSYGYNSTRQGGLGQGQVGGSSAGTPANE